MNDISAAIGLANITTVERLIQRHQANAAQYNGAFGRPWDDTSAAWLYTLLVEDRAGFIRHMADHHIACSPVHARNDTHAGFHYPNGPLPGVDHFASRNVAIPVGWWLDVTERRDIIDAVNAWS
jgi:dTDP-4-amino-4,6-dideoxygalactose transaminase